MTSPIPDGEQITRLTLTSGKPERFWDKGMGGVTVLNYSSEQRVCIGYSPDITVDGQNTVPIASGDGATFSVYHDLYVIAPVADDSNEIPNPNDVTTLIVIPGAVSWHRK